MKKITIALLFAFGLLSGLQEVYAQAAFKIGPRVGADIDAYNDVFLGADARIDLPVLPVTINPTFDYYFTGDDADLFQLSGNALYSFGINNQVFTPYTGVGVGYSRVSGDGFSDSDVGLNVIGGAEFGFGSIRPFAQAQVTLLGDNDFVTLAGGLLLRLNQ